jgi:hypothetical protein
VEQSAGTSICFSSNVITSRKPDDLPAFVVALMEVMRKG